jgi:hypothetical protein
MRKLILTTAILLAGLSAGYARGVHSTGTGALMAPAPACFHSGISGWFFIP